MLCVLWYIVSVEYAGSMKGKELFLLVIWSSQMESCPGQDTLLLMASLRRAVMAFVDNVPSTFGC